MWHAEERREDLSVRYVDLTAGTRRLRCLCLTVTLGSGSLLCGEAFASQTLTRLIGSVVPGATGRLYTVASPTNTDATAVRMVSCRQVDAGQETV